MLTAELLTTQERHAGTVGEHQLVSFPKSIRKDRFSKKKKRVTAN